MQKISLDALVREHLAFAADAPSRRSAVTFHGGSEHTLRQTLIALCAGCRLGEHETHGEATLQVLLGRVRVATADHAWDCEAGELLRVPAERHSLDALEDSALILTVVQAAAS